MRIRSILQGAKKRLYSTVVKEGAVAIGSSSHAGVISTLTISTVFNGRRFIVELDRSDVEELDAHIKRVQASAAVDVKTMAELECESDEGFRNE